MAQSRAKLGAKTVIGGQIRGMEAHTRAQIAPTAPETVKRAVPLVIVPFATPESVCTTINALPAQL